MSDGVVALGEAVRIEGDALITFRGSGPARFRIQHTRDLDGAPDALTWCDVSMISNADMEPRDAIGKDSLVPLLVDHIDGDHDIRYRRYRADWLRVLPLDDDEAAIEACARYAITIAPVPPA
ncbi:hypothetical protein [Bradyrhizobium sp. Ai1a-2]|uniref:hypothetical protein n=1 Tax=Bradyrhizobium sp. Ai1a-2 TaxID=196490 RepID=UPI0003FDF426|nr:hypothetical protein [Bradyrhizobium sp. Ai1a-2]